MLKTWRTGDKVPKGYFCCMECSDSNNVVIPETHDRFPVCPVCGGMSWYKIMDYDG